MSASDPVTRLNAALEGRYRIERELGQGGMATVYLADDLRHERKVALKVLKPELAAVVGAERFLAEIKTTANLQHPNILPLFDSGEADTFLFYVMPFVQGETLREKLDRDHQLPVDEAVRLASEVAEALDHAHRQGVVHRDIKPGNILLRDGRPLVADFGIALAVGVAGGGRMTETGLSMGTPHYMSPEQATGDQTVGATTDIYALGCVLYEMLVGDPPYLGSTAQAILGKIIAGEIASATTQRKSVPPNVDAAIRRALEKLPADRFSGAQDFARALSNPGFRYGEVAGIGAGAAAGRWSRLSIGMAAVATLFAVSTAWLALRPAPPEPVRNVERFAVPFLEGQEPIGGGARVFDLSPDGRMLVYLSSQGAAASLMVRRWDDLTATPVRASTVGLAPAVSFDGLELAFQQGEEIKVLAFSGGPVRTLTTGLEPEWGPDGFVYVSTDSGTVRIPSTGGAVEYVYRLAEREVASRVYDVLPDGRGALLDVLMQDGISEVRGVDLRSGEAKRISFGTEPRYLPSGHLVYEAADGSMMAARLDPDRMELLGTPIAVMDGALSWSLADDGKLFYSAGVAGEAGAGPVHQLAWVTRGGDASPADPDWTYSRGADEAVRLSLSPDGSTVALREFAEGGYDIWLKRLDAGVRARLTFDAAHEKMPAFEPSGRSVTYLSDRDGNFDVWRRATDGSGQPELLLDLEEDIQSIDWSPDGEWVLLWTAEDDILAYRPGEGDEPTRLLAEAYDELDPAVSPDGRWIAYVSNQTGANQVYVRPFPNVADGLWQVSSLSARYPRWAHDRRELYFQDDGPGPSMWRVEYESAEVFRTGPPTVLFDSPGWTGSAPFGEPFEVAPGDERFIVVINPGSADGDADAGPPFVLVNNFFEVLKRLVPE